MSMLFWWEHFILHCLTSVVLGLLWWRWLTDLMFRYARLLPGWGLHCTGYYTMLNCLYCSIIVWIYWTLSPLSGPFFFCLYILEISGAKTSEMSTLSVTVLFYTIRGVCSHWKGIKSLKNVSCVNLLPYPMWYLFLIHLKQQRAKQNADHLKALKSVKDLLCNHCVL